MTAGNIKKDLSKLADQKKSVFLQGYFKTAAGGYGAGDKFLGITVPMQRTVAKKYSDLPLAEISKLLKSNIHEHRFTALEILVMQYERAGQRGQQQIAKFYLHNLSGINNWDLVDTSAPYILGHYFYWQQRQSKFLLKMAKSKNLWQRRIAILATFYFISQKDFKLALKIAQLLVNDQQDLIQKAVGWMLREIGKRSLPAEEKFLRKHFRTMPRTMLRYAIEKFPESKRKQYLRGG